MLVTAKFPLLLTPKKEVVGFRNVEIFISRQYTQYKDVTTECFENNLS
jgi:hypothetical protein